MARGRSLLWLGILLSLASAASWLAREFEWGTPGIQSAWRPLTGFAAVAFALWGLFLLTAQALRTKRPDAARSLIHLQTVVSAIVALLALSAALGGLQSALVGVGLVGFGLTLALQRPILALAGWASLVVGGSARVGDRIRVGDLQGDVLDVTLFSTRLWEIGGAESNTPGRATGRIVTVSNAVFLEQAVANATSDTPTVFDEFVVNVAFEADLNLAKQLLETVGADVLDLAKHQQLAKKYAKLTQGLAMEKHFPHAPFVLMESKPSWMDLRLRYLVDAREAARVQTHLTEAWTAASAPHAEVLPQVYPRSQPQAIGPDGRARP